MGFLRHQRSEQSQLAELDLQTKPVRKPLFYQQSCVFPNAQSLSLVVQYSKIKEAISQSPTFAKPVNLETGYPLWNNRRDRPFHSRNAKKDRHKLNSPRPSRKPPRDAIRVLSLRPLPPRPRLSPGANITWYDPREKFSPIYLKDIWFLTWKLPPHFRNWLSYPPIARWAIKIKSNIRKFNTTATQAPSSKQYEPINWKKDTNGQRHNPWLQITPITPYHQERSKALTKCCATLARIKGHSETPPDPRLNTPNLS